MLPVLGELRPWNDPTQVAIGRLSTGVPLPMPDEYRLLLDGEWNFRRFDSPDVVPARAVARAGVEGWPTVSVPGNWTMQGQGDVPHYTNVQMPFPGPPPVLPDKNPAGVYRREFEIPAVWDGRRIRLTIGGADSVHGVYVNGRFVGYGTDARLPSVYDVTDAVSIGTNTVAILVVRYSAHSYIEDQDAWWMAGLHRSVELNAHPAEGIDDLVATADWNVAESTGMLDVTTTIAFGGTPAANYSVRARLETVDGELVAAGEPGDVDVNHSRTYTFTGFNALSSLNHLAVAPWSAEDPALYVCVVDLIDPHGSVIDSARQRIGFRHVEIVGPDLLINGKRVWIHGVNRHDHHPDRGTAITEADMRADLHTMRRHNITAIRTSHYPNASEFLDLCDELGFYVVDESNIESHAYNWYLCNDPAYRQAWLERGARMVQRDRNHASVIMWSLGNESGYGANHDALAGWIRHVDPTRPLHYEDAIRLRGWVDGGRAATDVVCPMYPTFAQVREYGEQVAAGVADRPFIMCEYAHAMGNAGGSLADYWEIMWSLPGLQGGFIWEWKDHGLRQSKPDGSTRLAYGGMFGESPHDGNFVADGLVSSEGEPHPILTEVAWAYRPAATAVVDGRVHVTNRRSFRDLTDLSAQWTLLVDGVVRDRGPLNVNVGPGETTVVDLPCEIPDTGEVVFTVTWALAADTWFATTGHIVAVDQTIVRECLPTGADARHEDVLTKAEPQLWRAATDNDGFKLFREKAEAERQGSRTLTRWVQQGINTRHARELVDYNTTTDADAIRHHFVVPDELADLPRVGVRHFVDARFDRVRWYGRGPGENYADRRSGSMIGVWESAIDALPYLVPQEFGLRTETRWLELIDSRAGDMIRIDAVDAPFHWSALRHTAEEIFAAGIDDELIENAHLVVSLDAAHRGIGTNACGPDVLPEYQIAPGKYSLAYRVSSA